MVSYHIVLPLFVRIPLLDPQFRSPFVPATNRGVLGGLADPRTTLRRGPPDEVPLGGAIQGDGAGVRAPQVTTARVS